MYLVASVCPSVCAFWHAAVDIRGSALPSATNRKEESLSVEGVCVSNNHVDAVDWLFFSIRHSKCCQTLMSFSNHLTRFRQDELIE